MNDFMCLPLSAATSPVFVLPNFVAFCLSQSKSKKKKKKKKAKKNRQEQQKQAQQNKEPEKNPEEDVQIE